MAVYFRFVCECHRGDLRRHLQLYDITDIQRSHSLINCFYLFRVRVCVGCKKPKSERKKKIKYTHKKTNKQLLNCDRLCVTNRKKVSTDN